MEFWTLSFYPGLSRFPGVHIITNIILIKHSLYLYIHVIHRTQNKQRKQKLVPTYPAFFYHNKAHSLWNDDYAFMKLI